ncbi:MAG TPA: phospholipase D-like domain-containing protein [Desulfobacterales bacterium]|nr:phospholipase D-like domain-containing protein [Desulfobacterales bacterium]
MNLVKQLIRRWGLLGGSLLLMVILFLGNACTRSLPETVPISAASRDTPIRVKGLASDEIWPHVFDQGDGSTKQDNRIAEWMRIEQQITGHTLIAGNQVEMLIDGPMTFEAMYEAMRNARHHIHLETYIFDDEELSRQFVDILIARHRAGVEVRLVIDGYGALQSDESVLDPLREAGVELFIYHPVAPFELLRFWRINTRHHRKLLVVDGRVGFLGGINISKVYASSSYTPGRVTKDQREGWRDTHLKVQGPIVAELQALFMAFWTENTQRPQMTDSAYFPNTPAEGQFIVRVASSMAADEAYEVYRTYRNAFAFARKTIWITQGYFSPDQAFLDALKAAARRGVDVRLLLPGLTDSWITISSSRAHYEELLEAGVRIFERRDVLQHAKTAVIDGIWSLVGSTNLDYRSFIHANDANLVIWSEAFAAQMERQFLDDQEKNHEITLSQWGERDWHRHLVEKFASLFDYWL